MFERTFKGPYGPPITCTIEIRFSDSIKINKYGKISVIAHRILLKASTSWADKELGPRYIFQENRELWLKFMELRKAFRNEAHVRCPWICLTDQNIRIVWVLKIIQYTIAVYRQGWKQKCISSEKMHFSNKERYKPYTTGSESIHDS